MKITNGALKKLIKEELDASLNERGMIGDPAGNVKKWLEKVAVACDQLSKSIDSGDVAQVKQHGCAHIKGYVESLCAEIETL